MLKQGASIHASYIFLFLLIQSQPVSNPDSFSAPMKGKNVKKTKSERVGWFQLRRCGAVIASDWEEEAGGEEKGGRVSERERLKETDDRDRPRRLISKNSLKA